MSGPTTCTAADLIAYIRAEEASLRASIVRRDLPPGSTRAKVTTANARWANAAEDRDRKGERIPTALRIAIGAALEVS